MAIETRNSATEEVLERFAPLTDEAIDQALNTAAQTFQHFRHTDIAKRATLSMVAIPQFRRLSKQQTQRTMVDPSPKLG